MEIRAHAQIQRLRLFVGRKRTLTLIWLLQKVSTRQMNERIRSFRDLDVWQAGMELVVSIYQLVEQLPATERFELSAQMRRAVVSVPSNVAEGHAFRTLPKMYRRHIRIALGSLAELETQVDVAQRLRMVDEPAIQSVSRKLERTRQLLHGLLRALRAIKEQKPR